MSSLGMRAERLPLAHRQGRPSRRLVTLTLVSVVAVLATFVSVPAYAASAPTVTNPGSQYNGINLAASVSMAATGGTSPYTWSATSLPTGLSINTSTGVVSGTPTAAGTYSSMAGHDPS